MRMLHYFMANKLYYYYYLAVWAAGGQLICPGLGHQRRFLRGARCARLGRGSRGGREMLGPGVELHFSLEQPLAAFAPFEVATRRTADFAHSEMVFIL